MAAAALRRATSARQPQQVLSLRKGRRGLKSQQRRELALGSPARQSQVSLTSKQHALFLSLATCLRSAHKMRSGLRGCRKWPAAAKALAWACCYWCRCLPAQPPLSR